MKAIPSEQYDEFSGFTFDEFRRLGSCKIWPHNEEDNTFKNGLLIKIKAFTERITKDIQRYVVFTKPPNVELDGKWNKGGNELWSAICFGVNDLPRKRKNYYPNINFMYKSECIELAINGEIDHSFELVYNKMIDDKDTFERIANNLPDFHLTLWYKVEYAPSSFRWIICDDPLALNELSVDNIKRKKKLYDNDWDNIKNAHIRTLSMAPSISDGHIKWATDKRNKKPHYAIRIEKKYPVTDVVKKNDPSQVIKLFENEILRLGECLSFFDIIKRFEQIGT